MTEVDELVVKAMPFPYLTVWRWRIERLEQGFPPQPPSLNIKDNFKEALELYIHQEFERNGYSVLVETVTTEYGQWELRWVKGDTALYRLEGATSILYKSDCPEIESPAVSVGVMISAVIISTIALIITYFFLQIAQTIFLDTVRRAIKQEFPCPYCDQVFETNSELTQHIEEAHAGQPAYVCKFKDCQARFETYEELQEHYRTVHGETDEENLVLILALVAVAAVVLFLVMR